MSSSLLPENHAGDAALGDGGRESEAAAEDAEEREGDEVAGDAGEGVDHWTARDERRGREV
jgi:hypothetical protein